MRIQAAARTHVGRRSNNEDAHVVDSERKLFVVADGMGGYEGGEVASRIVVHTLHDFFAQNAEDAELTWPWGEDDNRSFTENLMNIAVRLANREVLEQRQGRLRQMGSTVVALAIDGPHAVLAHVGDSRIYRLRDGRLEQLTRDHSFFEQLRAAGVGARPTGMSHVITRAIGFDHGTEPDLRAVPLADGDTFLLCSDGLTDPLDDAQIARLLALDSIDDACEALVTAAYDAGGSDNITAVTLRVHSIGEEDGVRAA